MAPDDIFAAQFWPWPDPAIKRDEQGQVLFVNGAFLALYGGTVQDWTGNVVGGWPAPQGPGQPYRFETRIPATDVMDEQVYDWMEMTLADGHAFALARNITMFMGPAATDFIPLQSPDAAIVADTAVADNVPQGGTVTAEQPVGTQNFEQEIKAPVDAPPVAEIAQNTAAEVPAEQAAPQAPAVLQTEAVSAPSHEPVVFAEYTPDAEVLAQVPDTATAAEPPAQDIPAQSPETAAPAATVAQAPQAAAAGIPAETNSSSDRAYERRALPIEESAVLGNNWRDAVIAKAVGAEPPSSDPVEDVTTNVVVEPTDVNTPKRILLAEDNAINALLTRTLLEAEGHVVETVQDGQLAVEAMKTASYDLIFMDMRMPNMDGLEATRKIRTLPNVSKDLPIIALTANAFDDDRNACFDSGMNDFMTKPVSAEELSEMVIQWTSPREQRMAS